MSPQSNETTDLTPTRGRPGCRRARLSAAAQQNEEFARRQYESGMSFLQNHRYAEALKDLQAVVDSFATSSVADNALLQIAQYQLENARDLDAAQTSADRLLKDFPTPTPHRWRTSCPGASPSRRAARRLTSTPRWPRSSACRGCSPATMQWPRRAITPAKRCAPCAATTTRLDRYRRVTMEYPRSTGRRARALRRLPSRPAGQGTRALPEFQRVRQQFPNPAAALDALNYNTIIYRLYVRPPAQPPYTFSGKAIGNERAELPRRDRHSVGRDGRSCSGTRRRHDFRRQGLRLAGR